jgi:hypothetical protein
MLGGPQAKRATMASAAINNFLIDGAPKMFSAAHCRVNAKKRPKSERSSRARNRSVAAADDAAQL